ncbi:MAG TPA: AAA family ATPase [Coleofasciculaceae cyanobacterium]|jgi:PAS domain S-box-containing protein
MSFHYALAIACLLLMIAVPGYQILTQISESTNSLVYRGIREQDNKAVILKVLKDDYLTPNELTRYQQEYQITHNLNLEGVVKAYSLETYHRTLVIIFEDFGASSLAQLSNKWMGVGRGVLSLQKFLRIAIQITEILGAIHCCHVIHKDINPSNIVLNPETGQLKIIDFGISTQLTRENPTLKNPNILEGTLAYISPEQTGRISLCVDYRTDFYSLGVTFYELLTGQLPFTTTDPLELVHSHIAKQPVPPHQVNPEIPQAVSDIVMKLMAKTVQDRYQGAWGIKVDLVLCLMQFEANGEIEDIILGEHDISDKFQIPQKLYGREREVATLLAAFERVVAGEAEEVGETSQSKIRNLGRYIRSEETSDPDSVPLLLRRTLRDRYHAPKSKVEMMLVAGTPGIGKSALVAEIHKPITEKHSYFIWGKFDQFGRNIPYSAIVTAFERLVRKLLTESEAQLNQWREKLLSALGSDGQVIIDVIPEVELIIGKQPTVPELGRTESQNRFNLVFQNFIRVFCSHSYPLVIFLDDLQWADSATLKLVELMMTDADMQYLLVIGAYRDNEVTSTHPLMMTLEKIKKQGATINHITLSPLTLEQINHLIAETLYSDRTTSLPLAELIGHKTGGNPFFVNEFLKTLHAENLIIFDFERLIWQWDLAQIEGMDFTDNVVELMIEKLNKLPESTQQVLQFAACVGSHFDLNMLSTICKKSSKEVFQHLTVAVQLGLILSTSKLDEGLLIQNYKFLDDRVQQAAYVLIDEEQKKAIHLQIGRLLLQNTVPDSLFKILDHLNLGSQLVTDQQERDQIAKLNLRAGQKAQAATAYEAAVKYLKAGLEFLSADSWQTQYDLTLALHSVAAEAAYLSGDWQQQIDLTQVVLQQARTLLDTVKVYTVKLQACMAQNKQLAAWETALTVLKLLGVEFPDQPSQYDIQQGLEETASNLVGKNPLDLIDLPQMTDPEKLATIKILSSVFSAAYQAIPEMFPLIVCKQVNLSIQYGNASVSAFAYATYGLILCGIAGDIESGCQFGKLALSLLNQLKAKEVKTRTMQIVYSFISHWHEPVSGTLQPLLEAYQSGLETGDLEYAAYCGAVYCLHSFFMGKELSNLELDMATYREAIGQLNQETALNYHKVYQQFVLNLLGKSANVQLLKGEAYNEEEMLKLHQKSNDKTAIFYLFFNKSVIYYLFYDYHQSADYSARAEKYLDGVTATLNIPLFYFYDSLAKLAIYTDSTKSEQDDIHLKVIANQEKMKIWAHHAPMNFSHKFELVEAERHRVMGRHLEAMDYYDRAIAIAKENEYINEEALANELAAKFYLAWGKQKIAQVYMADAHYGYVCWGATAKVKDLEERYPQLITQSAAARSTTKTRATTIDTTSSSQSGEALDLATVMKASQAIGSEIELDKLLENLTKILIENAGAQFGFLILEQEGELLIEAEGTVDGQVTVLQSMPIEFVKPDGEMPLVSSAIVNYVLRTKESVVLNDATRAGRFTNERYIKKYKPKSILCAPLMHQGQLSGIVYLENNLTTGAFTPDRLEVLQLLSGQAAIAIANAKLYAKAIESENRLTQFLEAMPVAVSVHDPTGQVYYANRTAQELLGALGAAKTEQLTEAYQVYRAGTQQLYPTEHLPIVRALLGERVKADDLELRQPDKIIPLEVFTTPIFDETGKVVYAIATFTDITERIQADKLITEYSRTLELQVQERTQDLEQEIAERRRTQEALSQSEAQNRAILSAIPDLMFRVSAEGIYLGYVATCEVIDLLPSDFEPIGKHISELLPPDVSQRHMYHLQQALATGKGQIYEQQNWINGKLQHEEVRVVVSGEDEVLFMIQDISDRKHLEEKLSQANRFLDSIVANIPLALFVKDVQNDWRYILWNQAAEKLYGVSQDEAIGRNGYDFVDAELAERFLAEDLEILEQGKLMIIEEEHIEHDIRGSLWQRFMKVPLFNPQQQATHLLCIGEDITARKQAEIALRQKNEELASTLQQLQTTQEELIQSEKMAALGQLVAGIAHEINTPLGAIRASISNISNALTNSIRQLPQLFQQLSPERQADFFVLLEAARQNSESLSFREERQLKRTLKKQLETQGIDDADSITSSLVKLGITQDITPFIPLLQEKNKSLILETAYSLYLQQNNSQNIQLAVDRASKIVFALKSYARHGDSGQMSQAQVKEGIDVVLTIYHNQLKQGIIVSKEYADVPAILCYPEELNQVWTNLIHNAIQAMNNKGKLEIAVTEQTNHIVVQITDSGCGIPPDIKSRIFEPFFTTKPAGEGSGLGLDIVNKIIEKHQGKIEVESQPGRTTFSVWLPIKQSLS